MDPRRTETMSLWQVRMQTLIVFMKKYPEIHQKRGSVLGGEYGEREGKNPLKTLQRATFSSWFFSSVYGVLTHLPVVWRKHKAEIHCGRECGFLGAGSSM